MSRQSLPLSVAFLILMGCGAAIGVIYFWEAERVLQFATAEKRERAQVVQVFLQSKLSEAASLVRSLAEDVSSGGVVTNSPEAREQFLVKARALTELNGEIDQVRMISREGRELLRVNEGGELVEEEQLQDKSSRKYFQDGAALAEGEVLVSDFALNVENGEVERPFRPMVRLATPLRRPDGSLGGLVVLNLNLERWFATLENVLPRGGSEFELLNANGYWERAMDRSREWGQDLSERAGASLARDEPELWAEMQTRSSGTFVVEGDHYVWLRVEFDRLLNPDGTLQPGLVVKGGHHFVLSRIPADEIGGLLQPIRTLGGASLALAILAAVAVAISLIRKERERRLEAEQDRERKARRLELDEQRGQLETAETVAGTGSWRWDLATDEMKWSDGMYRIFGRSKEDGAPGFADQASLFFPGDFEKLIALGNAAGEHGRDFRISLQRAVGGSHPSWIDVQGFAVNGEGGRVVEVRGFARDVSTEREAEDQMRLLATVAAKTNNLVVIVDPEGRIQWVNEAFCRVSGYAFEEISRRDFREILYGSDAVGAATVSDWARISGDVLQCTKSGRPYWVSATVEPLRDDGGKVTHYLAVQVDVTERRNRDEGLERHASMLEAAGEIANVGGWEFDLETMTPVWSKETRRIHEVDDDFVPTIKNALEFYEPEGRAVIKGAIEQSLATGEPHDCEVPFVTARGRRVLMRVKWAVERVGGRSVRLFGVIRDVTERRRIERDLIEARDRAKAASEAKSQFVANMSHEIRTPLNAILGMCELIRDEPNGPEAGEYLNTIQASGDALLGLITEILSFSQIEAEKVELREKSVNLRNLVGECLRLQLSAARKKDIHVDFRIAPGLPTNVRTDPVLLQQLLANLVGNAIKFTPEGTVTVTVGPGEGLIEGEAIRFVVVDTGIGIAEEDQSRVFRSFDQVDASDSRPFGGVGLGLAICQRLADLLDGRIDLKSELGVGSEFSFEIPLKPVNGNPESDAADEGKSSSIDRGLASRRPLTILIVEDSEINQRLTAAVLKKMGYSPDSVADGLEACEAAVRRRYDVILMDLQMPVMDGIRATQRIFADSRTGEPQVIALTANAQDEDRDRCLAVGMSDFLTKPLRGNRLAETLTKAHRRMFERIEMT